jgi:hypothetical protein
MSLPNGDAPLIVLKYVSKRPKRILPQYREINFEYGDIVATVASPGHDIGIVTLTGELVRIQMKKKEPTLSNEIPKNL